MKIVTGFNVVEDIIVEMNDNFIHDLIKIKPNIKNAILGEKDIEIEINVEEKNEILKIIRAYIKEKRIGGQAGIVGEELARNGYNVEVWSNYCSLPLIYAKARKSINECLKKLRQNIILEYKKGNKLLNHVAQDNNRLILADRSIITLPYSEIKIEAEKGFFSGYHHIQSKDQFKLVKENMNNIENVRMRHVELAMNSNPRIRKLIAKYIFTEMHSLGANVYEIKDYYNIDAYDFESIIDKIFKGNVERLHVHDRDKHYVVFDSRKSQVKNELKAMIEGNKAVISKAINGYVNIEYKLQVQPNKIITQTFGDYIVIEMPLIKAENPVFTVGLGDVLSSFSFVNRI